MIVRRRSSSRLLLLLALVIHEKDLHMPTYTYYSIPLAGRRAATSATLHSILGAQPNEKRRERFSFPLVEADDSVNLLTRSFEK